jgi:hypothetical protein
MSDAEKIEYEQEIFCASEPYLLIEFFRMGRLGYPRPDVEPYNNLARGKFYPKWEINVEEEALKLMRNATVGANGPSPKTGINLGAESTYVFSNDVTEYYGNLPESLRDLAKTTNFYKICRDFVKTENKIQLDQKKNDFRTKIHAFIVQTNGVDFTSFK